MPPRLLVLMCGAASAAHWILFFGGGRFDMALADWPRQTAYLSVLRTALREWRLPLETTAPLYDMGSGYVANLEAPLAPHTWLFALAGDHLAVLASAVLLSWIGVYGCARLARRLSLGPLAFVALTIAVCFNGGLVAHVSAGHLGWLGIYALPFIVECLILAMDGRTTASVSARAGAALALILAALMMAGAMHVVIMCGVMVAICAACEHHARRTLAISLGLAVLLSMYRILPGAAAFGGGGRTWIADGYSPLQMIEALLLIRPPATMVATSTTTAYGGTATLPLYWHEFDAYVGLFGVLLLAVFALSWSIRPIGAMGSRSPHERAFRVLLLTCGVMGVLACWKVYASVVVAPVSLLSVWRVPSRFFGVAVLVAMIVAIARADAWWRARPRDPVVTLAAWGAVAGFAGQLAYHSFTYSPARAAAFPATLLPASPMLTPASPVQVATVTAGAIVSVLALIWTARRFRAAGRAAGATLS